MDILEQLKTTEQKLVTIEQQLHATAMALPDPIFIIEETGKFLSIIGGQERSTFREVEFLTGKYLHDILPESLADRFLQTISEAVAGNTLKTLEYQLGPGDLAGSDQEAPKGKQWFEGRVYPVKDPARKQQSVVWLSINITERKNLERQLQELAEKDGLTGAYNRRHFMRILDQEFLIAHRYKSKLSVLLIDIDNFHEINDTYGLDGGDAVLKNFTTFCMEKLRHSDLLGRYSTEKLIAMLPNTPSIGAAILAERVRADIEEMSIPFQNQAVKITVSIGISLAQDSDTNSIALLNRAETALYQAKKKGRNRVEMA